MNDGIDLSEGHSVDPVAAPTCKALGVNLSVSDPRFKPMCEVVAKICAPEGCGSLLCQTRANAVPGVGTLYPEIVFIGEGPGQKEDEAGEPFVGAAGKFLNEMLASVGLRREDVYITNIVKCRPPGNRDPLPEEKALCVPFLDEQLEILKPKLIVLLGRHAMEYFLPGQKISIIHGQPKRKNGRIYLPLFHPAAALYNGGQRQTLLDDFQKIPAILAKIDEINTQTPSS